MPPKNPSPEWVLTHRQAIGANIRSARLHANITQEALSETAGVDRQTLNRIEQGHSAARLDTLIRLAAGIGVPLADLVRE